MADEPYTNGEGTVISIKLNHLQSYTNISTGLPGRKVAFLVDNNEVWLRMFTRLTQQMLSYPKNVGGNFFAILDYTRIWKALALFEAYLV